MTNNPEISIIVPAYNVQPWFEDCLESVRMQTHRNWECIIIDDFSSDETILIAQKFVSVDSRYLLVQHEQNRGLGESRNTGCKLAKGEFLFFLDSDDLIPMEALSNLISRARQKNSDLVIGDFKEFKDGLEHPSLFETYKSSSFFQQKFGALETAFNWKDIQDSELLFSSIYFTTAWGKLYRRSLWINLSCEVPAGLRMAEDFIPVKKFIFSANKISVIFEAVLLYRKREQSATTKKTDKAFEILRAYPLATDMFKEIHLFDVLYKDIHVFFFRAFHFHLNMFVPVRSRWKFYKKMSLIIKSWDLSRAGVWIDQNNLESIKTGSLKGFIKIIFFKDIATIQAKYPKIMNSITGILRRILK